MKKLFQSGPSRQRSALRVAPPIAEISEDCAVSQTERFVIRNHVLLSQRADDTRGRSGRARFARPAKEGVSMCGGARGLTCETLVVGDESRMFGAGDRFDIEDRNW